MSSSQIFSNLANVDDQNTLTFQIKDTEVAYVNTLRRMVLIGVESVAFRSDMNEQGGTTDVSITTNTTPMTNEMLAHRVGLVPVFCENPTKWDPEQYKFVLDVSNHVKL